MLRKEWLIVKFNGEILYENNSRRMCDKFFDRLIYTSCYYTGEIRVVSKSDYLSGSWNK